MGKTLQPDEVIHSGQKSPTGEAMCIRQLFNAIRAKLSNLIK